MRTAAFYALWESSPLPLAVIYFANKLFFLNWVGPRLNILFVKWNFLAFTLSDLFKMLLLGVLNDMKGVETAYLVKIQPTDFYCNELLCQFH